jgi:hypothetical protein
MVRSLTRNVQDNTWAVALDFQSSPHAAAHAVFQVIADGAAGPVAGNNSRRNGDLSQHSSTPQEGRKGKQLLINCCGPPIPPRLWTTP